MAANSGARRTLCGAVAVALLAVVCSVSPSAQTSSVARGKYIVEDVAMCPTCHSPARAQQGELARPLSGGAVPFRPATPTNDWAEEAPRLAGSPPGTDEEIVRLLMTGISRNGRRPRPPMPQFRMTRADAQSVVAYLRSLPASN